MLRVAILAVFALFSSLAYSAGLLPAVNADLGCTGSNQSVYYNGTNIVCGALGGGSITFPQTVGGTTNSGGIPYFSGGTTLSSSGVLSANALMVGGGAGASPSTITTGTGVLTALGVAVNTSGGYPTQNGAITTGHCLQWNSTSGITDSGASCGSGGGTTWGADSYTAYNTYGQGALYWHMTNPIAVTAGSGSGLYFQVTTDITGVNSGFANSDGLDIDFLSKYGNNVYGVGSNNKTTFLPLNVQARHYAAGQKFVVGFGATCMGMGDCAVSGAQNLTYGGANIAGDEGEGWQLASVLSQQNYLTTTTINSIPSQTTCNTTLTQNVTGSKTAQTVTVASSTNCNVNDWVVINRLAASGYINTEAVKITASAVGSITGIFRNNYSSGNTVTPAKVLVTSGNGNGIGQQRVLVNLTTASVYNTGTASAAGTPATATGTGTSWSTGMVGGDTINPGCITFAADDYTGSPFSVGSPVKSWYEINALASTTSLTFFSFDVAGHSNYRGLASAAGSYQIRPCARILWSDQTTVVLDTNTFTWTVGDSLEQIIAPYPDVSGYQEYVQAWTPGGSYRAVHQIRNNGARTFQSAINISSVRTTTGGADPYAWNSGILIEDSITAIQIDGINQHGILFSTQYQGWANTGDICWGGYNLCITYDTTPAGYWQMTPDLYSKLYAIRGTNYATIAVNTKFALGNQNYLTTLDATGITAARSVTVPDIGGTLLIGASATAASVPANFSATTYIPVNIGGTTYYVAAKTASW